MKTLKPEEVKTIIKNSPPGSNPNTVVQALINKGYILEGLNDKPVEKPDGFLKSIGKDVVETLVVKPADRVAEAVGRTGFLGQDIKKGYETMADEGESRQFNVPGLGEIDVEAQKGGSEGARQIGGEALKIGSFLFPYGKVAGAVGSKVLGASKLTPIALKTAKTVGNIASGATGGYLADVGYNLSDDSKTLGEAFTPGLGTLIGGSIPVAGTVFKAGKRAVQGSRNVKDVTKRVIQGETKDIPLAEQAFKNIDLKGVKSRQELSQRLSSAMENQMKVVDDYLSKDPRALSLDEYAIRTTNNVGQEVKTDVISNALTHLEDFYKQAGDNLSASNIGIVKQKAISEGLTHQEVNNIARMYSEEFGSKAFNKVGDPLTSVNAQMFENTRSGLKQASRGGLGYGAEAKQADKLYSAMTNTKRLIDKGAEGVNKLEARLKNRNIIQKLSYGAVKVINALTGGALKAGVEALGVSNIGNKIDNWINLERSLQKDLEFIQKANNIRTDSALIKFIEDFSKRFKFPGDAMVDDLSTRGKQLKNIPNKQGGFVSLGQSESALPIKRTTNTIKKNIPKASNISPNSTTKSLKGKGTIPENSNYLYHGTGGTSAEAIFKEGLKPGRKGTLSLSKDEAYSRNYAQDGMTPQGKTYGTMFRVKADYVKGKTIPVKKTAPMSDQLNEILTKETIPPEAIEVYRNGKWQPLKSSPENSLISEAKKYKSAEEFANNTPSDVLDKLREAGVRGGEQRMKFWEDATGKKTGTSYQMSHRPSEGVSAFDLTEKVNGEQMIPKDMYTQWYGSRGTATDLESISVLKKIKGKPEADVTIYRASPKESFNEGDWVTFSKKYAQEHAKGNNTKVFSKVVKAKDVRWAMDDVNEFGYFPKSQLTDIWKKANKK